MNVQCYLKIRAVKSGYGVKENEGYFKPTNVTVTKNRPATEANEIAIKLNLNIPNSFFLKPQLQANIHLNELQQQELDINTIDQLSEILSDQLGQKIHLTVGSDNE
jgi:hypothetical protein